MNFDSLREVRETWQPAPGSRLDVAIREAMAAALRGSMPTARVAELRSEAAGARARLDGATAETPTALIAGWHADIAAVNHVLPDAEAELSTRRREMAAAYQEVTRIVNELQGLEEATGLARNARKPNAARLHALELERAKRRALFLEAAGG